jgi:hypothetical protein
MDLLRQLMRIPLMLGLWSMCPVGSLENRITYGIHSRPHYAYGVYWAAITAERLRVPKITVIEFGVAGGRGLVALEKISAEIAQATGVQIQVVGFDTGQGMPGPLDYRDLPHIWNQGFYPMDQEKLRSQLTHAELVLGDVADTTLAWLEAAQRAPIGFIAFDLDYYSSTKAAFNIFSRDHDQYLPRVYCYFDDVVSNDLGCMNEHVGELLAIREFNADHATRKIARIEQLRQNRTRWEVWQERMYVFHDFMHPDYTKLVVADTTRNRQRPL